MDFENVIKNSDNDFIVFVDLEVRGSGYNVVPKSVDLANKYNIEDVRAYCLAHPDKVFDDYHPQVPEPTWADRLEAQVLYSAMLTNTLLENY